MKDFLNRLKAHKVTIICTTIVILSLGIGITYLKYEEIAKNLSSISTRELIAFIICFPGIVILFIFYIKERYLSIRKEVDDYYEIAKKAVLNSTNSANILKKKKEKKSESNDEINKDATDIIELMLLNMKEIKEYYVLSKTMSKRSFRSFLLSVIMCIFGFIIISASIIAMFVIDISFTQSVVPVIGGAIVEVIAGTSLVVYKKSLEQLNQYYDSLHNNERFLSLVNIVDKLSDDKKDETYINIINNQLEALKYSQ